MALIPPFFMDAVVALGLPHPSNTKWIGTGFLYLHVTSRDAENAHGRTYLVTNKHVLEGFSDLRMRANPQADEPTKEFDISLVGANPLWFGHPDASVDVGVVPINYQALLDQGMQVGIFHSDLHVACRAQLAASGASEGDGCFVLGFPMAMVGERRSSVIVRLGAIARIRDTIAGASNDFLVDAQVFPGNSGGPVVLRPDIVAIGGTKASNNAHLVGIVRSYVPYQDIAISQQTSRPRVIFEENTGLASVHPVDYIEEAIAVHFKSIQSGDELDQASETIESPGDLAP